MKLDSLVIWYSPEIWDFRCCCFLSFSLPMTVKHGLSTCHWVLHLSFYLSKYLSLTFATLFLSIWLSISDSLHSLSFSIISSLSPNWLCVCVRVLWWLPSVYPHYHLVYAYRFTKLCHIQLRATSVLFSKAWFRIFKAISCSKSCGCWFQASEIRNIFLTSLWNFPNKQYF